MHSPDDKPVIRPATLADSERIASLSAELGYPTDADGVRRRLNDILRDSAYQVYVIELEEGYPVGWIAFLVWRLVMVDPIVEICSLIIDERYRSRRLGELLIERAEQWAHEQGCREMWVHSNIIRARAHRFYERLGYANFKTSYVSKKAL